MDWRQISDEREKYQAYLCSRDWAVKKEAVHARAGGNCERCRKRPIDAVHHETYARKYEENLAVLIGLCAGCHRFIHKKSDFDPAEFERSTSRPLSESLIDSHIKSNRVVCPFCECEQVHLRDAKMGTKILIATLFFYCENGHAWETVFVQGPGECFAWTTGIRKYMEEI